MIPALRVIFVTKPHLPPVGGAQVTEHLLALAMRDRGHTVAVLCPTDPVGRPEHGHEGVDLSAGYPTSKRPDVPAALRGLLGSPSPAPDVAVVGGNVQGLGGVTEAVLAELRAVPTVLYLHDAPSAALAELPFDRVLAASRFIAGLVRCRDDVEVLPPIVDRRRYAVATSRRTALFVNPVPEKGLHTALALAARRPDVPFAFTRCWPMAPPAVASLHAELRRLGNVELRDAVTDPRALYGDARVLLVPSVGREGFGRVAREAQCSGIPVIASRVGGLTEAIGNGGILVDPKAGVTVWAETLSRVWDDPLEYARLSEAAASNSRDRDCAADRVGARFEAMLQANL